MVSIYIKGYKYYYQVDEIKFADVSWSEKEVVMLVNPTECFEEDTCSEVDETKVQGIVYIPKNKIMQVIYWT